MTHRIGLVLPVSAVLLMSTPILTSQLFAVIKRGSRPRASPHTLTCWPSVHFEWSIRAPGTLGKSRYRRCDDYI